QKTTTTPVGRDIVRDGFPLKISEMLAMTEGCCYVERTTVNSPKNVLRTKKAISAAFQTQIDDEGFSLIEILSACPTNWRMSPVDANRWIDEVMSKEFPVGVIVDRRRKKKNVS
ncbi:MAG: 2-oxoglutarate oxidoreductase, partial [Deltaproteobacteria bacterium]